MCQTAVTTDNLALICLRNNHLNQLKEGFLMNLHNFEAVLMEEAEVMRKMESSYLKRRMEVLSTFIPDEIINMKLTELDQSRNFVAVVLSGDISGITSICEKYCKAGNAGVHSLTAILNCYLSCIVETIRFYGGDVIKFSYDTLLAIWKATPGICLYKIIHEVVICALFIQQNLRSILENVEETGLKLKLTIACGDVIFCVIGNENAKEFVVSGSAINDLNEFKSCGCVWDIVVAPSAWGHVAEDSYEVLDTSTGSVKVLRCIYQPYQKAKMLEDETKRSMITQLCKIHVEYRKRILADNKVKLDYFYLLPPRCEFVSACKRWSINDMRPFISKAVLEQIDAQQSLENLTEIRELTVQLICVVTQTDNKLKICSLVNNIYEIVSDIINGFSGIIVNLSFLEINVKICSVFGFGVARERAESQNALKSAYLLRGILSTLNSVTSVSVSVANGFAYCGIVGHPFRNEFLVAGIVVNKAARLTRAFPQKVSCDHHTYNHSKLPSWLFRDLNPWKGDFGVVFEYNESFREKLRTDKHLTSIVGRDAEMELVEFIVNNPEVVQNYRAICFHGKSKIGKTRLLKEALNVCLGYNHSAVSLTLCGRVQRPYFCICLLYRQLYNSIIQMNTKELMFDFPRELWDLSDVLPLKNVKRNEDITKTLLELCAVSSGATIFIVDNVQYIDIQSFEVITGALKDRNIRFICGGQFEEDTWDVRWKMSLNKDIKLLEIRSLPSKFLPALFCQFLNVEGIDKKLIKFLDNSKNLPPGFLKIVLKTLIKNNKLETKRVFQNEFSEHRYVFPAKDAKQETAVIVAKLDSQGIFKDDEITLSIITMQLYNSFTPFQQLVIRTAAVIGQIFSRRLLSAMLGYPKEELLGETIKCLFEEEVFDCATKYITLGVLSDHMTQCVCVEHGSSFEKCGYCKLIYFKDRNLRLEIYNLCLASERKELHVKISNFLENEDKSCPLCFTCDFASVMKLDTFKDFITVSSSIENIEFAASESKCKQIEEGTGDFSRSKRSVKIIRSCWKAWEPSTCFCLELFVKTYSDLAHHCEFGDHLAKQIFFTMQYGTILMSLDENKEAVKYLTDAIELCILAKKDSTTFDSKLKKSLFARINLLLADASLKLDNVDVAKKHVVCSLMQRSIEISTLSRRTLFAKTAEMFAPKPDVVTSVSLLSKIFAAEGQWNAAKAASLRSLKLLRTSNSGVHISCGVYRTALEIFGSCGDGYVCRKLEKYIRKDVMRKFEGNFTAEYYSISDLMNMIFNHQILNGRLSNCLKIGLRTMELYQRLHTSHMLLHLIPILSTLLLFSRRIEDAIIVMKILKNRTKTHHDFLIAYYGFCLELNNETSLVLEPINKCLHFVTNSFRRALREPFTPLETKLVINSISYYLRNRRWHQAEKWSGLLQFDSLDSSSFISILNFFRGTECSLLSLVHEMETKKNFVNAEEERVSNGLVICEEAANQWKVFLPRYLHLKAYFCQLMSHHVRAKRLLNEASDLARQQGNILEECWVNLNKCVWNGGFSFGNNVKNIDWKLEKMYSTEQWSQIMFSLPLNSS